MKIHQDKHYRIEYESNEEFDIFCKFIFDNDFFIRKKFKTLVNYKDYFNKYGRNVIIDQEYHLSLSIELRDTIDNYKRKNKLKKLNEL